MRPKLFCLLLFPVLVLPSVRGFSQIEIPGKRVTGKVTVSDFDFKLGRVAPRTVLPGARVFLRKDGVVRETRSDEAGNFQFEDVPPGVYEALCLVPKPFVQFGPDVQNVRVTAERPGWVAFTAYTPGSISGRVLNRSGSPARRIPVCLGLVSPLYPDAPGTLRTISDEKGSFSFQRVPPGQYHIGLRLDRGDPSILPYPRVYLPGVTDPSQATTIELGEAEQLADLKLILPEPLPPRVIAGRVVLPSGSPAVYATVVLEITDYPYVIKVGETMTDLSGAFSLPAFNGFRYRVRAVGAIGKAIAKGETESVRRTGPESGLAITLHSPRTRPVNLLLNPYADLGAEGWKPFKETLIDRSLGNACFAVRNGGYFFQNVGLPLDSAGKYALLFGRLATERLSQPGSATGLPYLYGYMLTGQYGNARILSFLDAESMTFRGKEAGEWEAAYGVFLVPPETRVIRFFLQQGLTAGDPHTGSLARFDDLALCLFDTQEEAWAFVNQLDRSNWQVRKQVDVATPWDSSTPAEARLSCSACATHRAPARRIRGQVELKCDVGPDGKATGCRVERGLNADWDRMAIEVVKTRWEFTPATEHGRPVAGSAVVEVTLVDCID